jgi:hypothetical protein
MEPDDVQPAEEATPLDTILAMVDEELARLRGPVDGHHWWQIRRHAWWDGVHDARMVTAWKLEDIRRVIATELQEQRRGSAQP